MGEEGCRGGRGKNNGHRGEWRLARKVMEEREHRGAFPATHSQLLRCKGEVQRETGISQ